MDASKDPVRIAFYPVWRHPQEGPEARAERLKWLRSHLPANCPDKGLDAWCVEVKRQIKELEALCSKT